MELTSTTAASEVQETVLGEIAAREGVEAIDLPPLFEAIDPDALRRIFAPTSMGNARVGEVRFPYAGYEVTVRVDGDVDVTVE